MELLIRDFSALLLNFSCCPHGKQFTKVEGKKLCSHFQTQNFKASPNVGVTITKFKLDNKWLKPGDKDSPLLSPIAKTSHIELSYRQRSFTVHFQPSDLSNPELVNYKYILEGSDEGEVILGGSNELRFSLLSPGDYTLKIYARIGDGPWGNKPAVLSIHIK